MESRTPMKILVFSDVHGNKFGLERVLEAGAECDALLCLGDIVGYGAHPNECCELLRELDAECLSGNHDAAALGKISIEWFNPVAQAAILWTRRQLSEENREWLESLPAQGEWIEERFQAVHASLREPWEEYIIGKAVAQPNFEIMTQPLCFYGHTHQADVYRCHNLPGENYQLERRALPNGGVLEMEDGWRYLINPGSCGQPRDGNNHAKYAIFDVAARRVEVFGVEYDAQSARMAIIEAGLPSVLGDRLLAGR